MRAALHRLLLSLPTEPGQEAIAQRGRLDAVVGEAASDYRARLTRLSEEQLRHAEAALLTAEQLGVGCIPDALRWYATHHTAAARAPLLPAAVEDYLKIKTAEGCEEHTLRSYRSHLRRFAEYAGAKLPADVAAEEFTQYLERWPNRTTRRAVWQALVSFYSWCWRRKYVPCDPRQLLGRFRRREPSSRYVLTPPEAKALLRAASESGEVGYWALNLFAGLRWNEIKRLQAQPSPWSIVNLDAGVMELPDEITKTGERIVPILPVLSSWLEHVKRTGARFYPRNHIEKSAKLRAAVLAGRCGAGTQAAEDGLLTSRNIGRHSYIAYRLVMPGASYAKIADEVGNSEAVLRKYYRHTVTASDAQKYFALTPQAVRRTAIGAPGASKA